MVENMDADPRVALLEQLWLEIEEWDVDDDPDSDDCSDLDRGYSAAVNDILTVIGEWKEALRGGASLDDLPTHSLAPRAATPA